MSCSHSYQIRTSEAIYVEHTEEWLCLNGPFYRNDEDERCIAYGGEFFSIEGNIELKTFVACRKCGEGLI